METGSGLIVGMAASLIVLWDDYDMKANWREFTDHGSLRNHDPRAGRPLYGAEVMVNLNLQRKGFGKALYKASRDITGRPNLLRIRAGARMRGYHRFAKELSPEECAIRVAREEILDPTISFQLRCLGHAAVIEWINRHIARPADYAGRDPGFMSTSREDYCGGYGPGG